MHAEICPVCKGTGRYYDHPEIGKDYVVCHGCAGDGWVEVCDGCCCEPTPSLPVVPYIPYPLPNTTAPWPYYPYPWGNVSYHG